jgi:hypothetical protein
MGARRLLGRFQIRFCSIYYACIRHRPAPVAGNERLTRFAFDDQEIKGGRAHWRLFFSAKGAPISVIRTTSFSQDTAVWRFGNCWVASIREQKIVGRADFMAFKLERVQLMAVPFEPPPKHADLEGWPTDKEARRSVAQQFALELDREPKAKVMRGPESA